MKKCYICQKEVSRLAKHISAAHPEEEAAQEALVLKYYKEGLSARKIAAKPDVMYSGGTSVVRVLKKHFTPEELEAGRRERIGASTADAYAKGEREWVSEINIKRSQSEEGRKKNSLGLKRAYETGKRVAWRKGKTKLTDPRIDKSAEKTSETMKKKAESGELVSLFPSGKDSPFWKGGVSVYTKRYSESFSLGDRKFVFRKFSNKCNFCGKTDQDLQYEKHVLNLKRWELECDHIVPISKGGSRDINNNAQALCTECHLIKSIVERGFNPLETVSNGVAYDHLLLSKYIGGNVFSNYLEVNKTKIIIIPLAIANVKNDFSVVSNDIIFFKDEWIKNREIVLSMLTQRVGRVSKKLGARKCVVKEVAHSEEKQFLNDSHLSGYVRSKKAWGLYYNNELVSLISIRTPFTKKHIGSVEIARFASKKDMVVVGGLSKLLKSVKTWSKNNDYKSILTYADLRIGEGKSYEKVGFRFDGRTTLNYFYTDGFNRYNRFKFRAQNGMTEKEYAASKGVHRIYGPGSNRYILDL